MSSLCGVTELLINPLVGKLSVSAHAPPHNLMFHVPRDRKHLRETSDTTGVGGSPREPQLGAGT